MRSAVPRYSHFSYIATLQVVDLSRVAAKDRDTTLRSFNAELAILVQVVAGLWPLICSHPWPVAHGH